jgi:hypothetical protein
MKKLKIVMLIGILFLLPVFVLAGCGGGEPELGEPTSYITLNVNPSVELIADNNQRVLAINPITDDAALLLLNKNYYGLSVDVVVRELVHTMAQTGTITAFAEGDAQAVFVSVYSINSDTNNIRDDIMAKIKATAEQYFLDNGIYATVAETTFDNKIGDYARANEITDYARFRAILKAMEYDADVELTELIDMTPSELLNKLFEEVTAMSQILSKEQKDSYLDARLTLKESLQEDLVTLFNNPTYTQLYNELENLKEQYRTASNVTYANSTIKPLILDKEEEIEPLETQLRTQFRNQIAVRKSQYQNDIQNLHTLKAQLSQNSIANFEAQLEQNKTEFLSAFEARQNYVNINSYLWSLDYADWNPNTEEELSNFLSSISATVTQVKASTRADVTRALNRINPYSRSEFFGDSSGGTWTFP